MSDEDRTSLTRSGGTIDVDDVPDPMAAEWAPQATKAGIFVFPSAPPATDFETGIPVKRNPIAPYYGSDA